MPTQWRTIAPIVGRTPSQCLERYEKLLDAACVKDDNYEPGDDPRKLRPGEIDPNPESKPARPDPVDMDEDEKEMLSEARARLANTRGKKAKRKAREKQLEEARRLASLQKRRELKAAGIDTRQRKRKRKGIDYNAEIPFEKRPPPGFFDVSEEDRPVEQPKFPTTIEELEGKRRVDVEAQLRKQDIAKNKIAQRQDAPSAVLQANKLNDPEMVRKRSKLMLPAPQISDHELEEIAKMGYASDLLAGNEELAEGSGATRALLANYAQTPRQGMTPFRTPQRTPAGKGDAIMMEAENLARLRESQTPLLGGENPELHPSDFSGVTPRKKEIQTPNPMLTPSATPGGVGLTPRSGMTPARDAYSFGMTPKGTPIRDELRINEDMDAHDSAKLESQRQADLRRNLSLGLGNLPQPKNEYQVVMQPIPEDKEEPEEMIEEDMSDRIARERAEEEARRQALLRKRSKVLQRELPRPPTASLELIRNSLMRADGDKSSFVPPTPIEQADEMIRKELLALLEHDNAKYPIDEKASKERKKGSKRTGNGPTAVIPTIDDFEETVMEEADYLIKEEARYLCAAMGHENESLDEFVEAHKTCLNDLMYFPTRNAYGLSSVAGNHEKLAALQDEFEYVKKKMDDDTEKAVRLEKKVKVLTHGYETRSKQSLWPQIEATFKQIDTAATELECFEALQKQEISAASHRISGIWEEVQKQKELERTLQLRYGNLLGDLEKMQKIMVDLKAQAQKEEEIAAQSRALQLAEAEAEADQTVGENADSSEAMSASVAVDCENSVPVTSTSNELTGEQLNSSVGHEHETSNAMDIDTEKESVPVSLDIGLSDNKLPSTVRENASLPDNGFEDYDKSQTTDVPSQELPGPVTNGTPDVTVTVENNISNDSVDGTAIENVKCRTDIVEEVKDAETQQSVTETENNSDVHLTNLDSAAPASSNEGNGELPSGEGEAMESNV